MIFFFAALAAPCGDLDALELQAARSPLSTDTEQCLDRSLPTLASAERAKASFALILSAHARGDLELYADRMRTHLTSFHTTDAEVAYLLARHLWGQSGERAEPPYASEILRWSRVAMNGRTRWLHNRRNYDEMVHNLYDMLVQSSMQVALQDQAGFRNSGTDEARLLADQSQRRARHYLIVAAPCLHKGECGPTLEVYIEGMRECDDLGVLENYVGANKLDDGHRSCLRARFRRPGAPKRRLLDLLIRDAEAQATPDGFEFLLAWHWNTTDTDDPEMAYRFTAWLASHDGDPETLARWCDAALLGAKAERIGQLHRWRATGWRRALASAVAAHAAAPSERTRRELDAAKIREETASSAEKAWCGEHSCP